MMESNRHISTKFSPCKGNLHMKKGNWTLLILIAILLTTAAATAVVQLMKTSGGRETGKSSEPFIKLEAWNYAWNDPPEAGNGNPEEWSARPSEEWQEAERLLNPEGRSGGSILWMQTRLPQDIGHKPHILIQASQLFEVYSDDRLVFRHGLIKGQDSRYIGTPPRLISLPDDAGGKMLSVRIYSDGQDIGFHKKPVIASHSALVMKQVNKQAHRFILGCFYILTGGIGLYPYSKLRQSYLFSFAGFAVSFGLYTITRTSLVYLLWDNPEFWMIFEMVALVLAIGSICAFTEQLFSTGSWARKRILSRLHFWFGALAVPLVAVHAINTPVILFAYQLLLLLSIVLVVARVARIAYRKDPDAQIVLAGLLIFCVSGALDIMRQLFVVMWPLPELAYWGVFFFLISLIVVIIKKIHLMLFRLSNTEKLSVAGQMAAGVAHEIRNPVTVISGYLQLMRRDSPHKPMIELMLGEVNRIQLLVNEFLFLAKPSEPRYELKSMKDIIGDVLQLFEAQASDSSIKLVFHCPESLPSISCDENQMKQVLVNVIKNGIEAMLEEGGELRISVEVSGQHMSITVSDTGCGITENDLSQIGEPFFTTKENGNGLGVMICRRIVEGHGGSFKLSSKVEEGTTVQIILPLSRKK
jgi:two-component system, sporulation sensor kinase E